MALGHKWAKRLKGGELIVVLFTSDRPNISWNEQQVLKRAQHRFISMSQNLLNGISIIHSKDGMRVSGQHAHFSVHFVSFACLNDSDLQKYLSNN